MSYEVLGVKKAAELSILDLGFDITYNYVKKYWYGGVEKEKVISINGPRSVIYLANGKVLISHTEQSRKDWNKNPTSNYWCFNEHSVALDTEIVITTRKV